MDGHADFIHIRKGLSKTSEYTLIPFKDLQDEVVQYQQERKPPA
jgi:hypothetical protein